MMLGATLQANKQKANPAFTDSILLLKKSKVSFATVVSQCWTKQNIDN